jgi:hypothetical protein
MTPRQYCCSVTSCACVEVCLPSRNLETDCVTPLFHCWYVYHLETADSVAQPFLHSANTPQYYHSPLNFSRIYSSFDTNIIAWGTMTQAGRSRVRFPISSLNFSIGLILPDVLWPWGRLSLYQKWVPGIFLGGKGRPGRKADNFTTICEQIV